MASSDNKQKRFIAGAICPLCASVDRIYTLTGAEGMSRHCVDCDFSEDLEASQKAVPDIQIIKMPGA